MDDIEPASLSTDETKRFNEIIHGLPKTVLNDGDVEAERHRERVARDEEDGGEDEDLVGESAADRDGEDQIAEVNDAYRMLKNNEILGQVLRSRYGRLTRSEISSIIETISEGGLRLVNYILRDEREIEDLAKLVSDRIGDDASYEQVVRLVQLTSFVWTMVNVEAIVGCVNRANIREVLETVVKARQTPAYDLIGYFSRLDGARELDEDIKRRLRALLRKHRDPFLRAVLSLRTQHYMNTHRSDRAVEQSFCQLLGIPPKRFLMRHSRGARTGSPRVRLKQ